VANQPHPVEQLFARRLKTARAAAGLTMRDLQAKSGAPINTTSRAERGLGIAFGSAARIAEGLGYTLSEFLSSAICDACANRPAVHMVCADCGRKGDTDDPR
jgi:transcriptional regulator with XRE-family HTH domain